MINRKTRRKNNDWGNSGGGDEADVGGGRSDVDDHCR